MKLAKFRGVPFHVEDGDDEPGAARNIIHEYPGRKRADAENAGNFPRRFSMEAHVIGEGFEVRLADLESALAEPGEGTLEHPTRGKVTVVVDGPVHVRYSTRERGIARIAIVFCEVGEATSGPSLSVDTGLSLLDSVEDMLDGMRLARLDLSGFDFVRKAANAVLMGPRSVTSALRQINTRLHNTIGIVDDFSQAIDDFTHEVDALFDTPAELAIKLQGLIGSVLRAVKETVPLTDAGDRQSPESRVAVAKQNLKRLGTVGDAQPTVQLTTPTRRRQLQNQNDLTDLVEASALALTCALFVDLAIETPAQGDSVLEATDAIFDRILERGTLEDDTAQRLRRLRADFFAHLRRVAVDLDGMGSLTPSASTPAILIAWNLYGDATRAEEIVRRNGISHPGFVQGGVPLAVPGA